MQNTSLNKVIKLNQVTKKNIIAKLSFPIDASENTNEELIRNLRFIIQILEKAESNKDIVLQKKKRKHNLDQLPPK
jgi:hypothetical protein